MQQCEASAANGYSMQCDAFCQNPAHSVVAENCMPGASPTEWDVNGAGHEVEGFATRASLLPGYTVEFKIRSLRAEALRVDVYRHGYYQGLGARLATAGYGCPQSESRRDTGCRGRRHEGSAAAGLRGRRATIQNAGNDS